MPDVSMRRSPATRKTGPSSLVALIGTALLGACSADRPNVPPVARNDATLDAVAEEYVQLALAFRRFDGDYVDAYFGPEAWADVADARSLDELHDAASALAERAATAAASRDPLAERRRAVLEKRIAAMRLRMEMAGGTRIPFDQESMILFDAVAPDQTVGDFVPILADIDALVPGPGTLADRVEAFRRQFIIPSDRLDAVMQAAIDECRRRTLEHIALPDQERFTLEFVTDQPWSGYNWYKGGNFSVIQINTDLPIYIERAVDLGCHEGYPGHHTYNVLIEQELVAKRGWVEYTLNPLYGPQSLISEGSANFGIDMAFPGNERREFEKQVLFPLAGIDPTLADRYYDLQDVMAALSYAGNEAARDYLNGEIDAAAAAAWLVDYALSTPERAAQRVRFFDSYRSYVINYNLGRDLVEAYIERRAGENTARRWEEFERLLSEPIAAGDLL